MVFAAHHADAYQEGNREINHPALLGAENDNGHDRGLFRLPWQSIPPLGLSLLAVWH